MRCAALLGAIAAACGPAARPAPIANRAPDTAPDTAPEEPVLYHDVDVTIARGACDGATRRALCVTRGAARTTIALPDDFAVPRRYQREFALGAAPAPDGSIVVSDGRWLAVLDDHAVLAVVDVQKALIDEGILTAPSTLGGCGGWMVARSLHRLHEDLFGMTFWQSCGDPIARRVEQDVAVRVWGADPFIAWQAVGERRPP